LHLVSLWTVIPHHHDDGDGAGLQNVGLCKSFDVAVCPRKLCWFLLLWKLQDIHM
jgi:hypothetical protein